MRRFLAICALFALSACGSTHDIDRPMQFSKRLDPSASAYVTVPQDGYHDQTVYQGSGMMTANAVVAAFQPHFSQVFEASAPQTLESAMVAAREMGASYVIAPAILHWEERAGQWSLRSDRAGIELSVIEVATGDVIETAVVKAVSGYAAYFVRRRPQQLLPAPLNQYADSLFPERTSVISRLK